MQRNNVYFWWDEENVIHFSPQLVQPNMHLPPAPLVEVSPIRSLDFTDHGGIASGCAGSPVRASGTTPVAGGENVQAPPAEPLPAVPASTETAAQRLERLKQERQQHLLLAASLLLGIASGFVIDRR